VKNFMIDGRTPQQAIAAYGEEVKAGTFPSSEHEFA
jgi:ketopantoate hydroxymethyltransferase